MSAPVIGVAGCLLLYSLTMLVAGPPLLRELTQRGHAPRFGVAAWLTAIGTVLLIWLAAAATIIVEVVTHWGYPRLAIGSCLAWLRGLVTQSPRAAPITLAVVGALLAVLVVAAGVRLAATVARMRANAQEHAEAVRLVGHRTADADVVVVDAPEPAAYCVSGRPPVIVVTSAAVAALDDQELAAVLAHERAHLAGHHSMVVTALRALAAVFPKLTLMRAGAVQVPRLLEMCADDVSARRHGGVALLSGLITMCRAAPAGTLAAGEVAVLARAERLATPAGDPATVRARAALASIVAVMVAAPVMLVGLAASGVPVCGM